MSFFVVSIKKDGTISALSAHARRQPIFCVFVSLFPWNVGKMELQIFSQLQASCCCIQEAARWRLGSSFKNVKLETQVPAKLSTLGGIYLAWHEDLVNQERKVLCSFCNTGALGPLLWVWTSKLPLHWHLPACPVGLEVNRQKIGYHPIGTIFFIIWIWF